MGLTFNLYSRGRQPPARGPDVAREVILSGPRVSQNFSTSSGFFKYTYIVQNCFRHNNTYNGLYINGDAIFERMNQRMERGTFTRILSKVFNTSKIPFTSKTCKGGWSSFWEYTFVNNYSQR